MRAYFCPRSAPAEASKDPQPTLIRGGRRTGRGEEAWYTWYTESRTALNSAPSIHCGPRLPAAGSDGLPRRQSRNRAGRPLARRGSWRRTGSGVLSRAFGPALRFPCPRRPGARSAPSALGRRGRRRMCEQTGELPFRWSARIVVPERTSDRNRVATRTTRVGAGPSDRSAYEIRCANRFRLSLYSRHLFLRAADNSAWERPVGRAGRSSDSLAFSTPTFSAPRSMRHPRRKPKCMCRECRIDPEQRPAAPTALSAAGAARHRDFTVVSQRAKCDWRTGIWAAV